MSLRVAAALIKNQDDFIILIIQTQKDILLAVQQEQDIEGPLQLEEQNEALSMTKCHANSSLRHACVRRFGAADTKALVADVLTRVHELDRLLK